ncbi:UDP-glycosyltransferase 1-like [Coffea arabica]|uniref:UDP-glycosyltransferase 1-like n=1 Tax=Coffea arabica TaxID=13443 RepID=A0ABM4W3C5_COFAR
MVSEEARKLPPWRPIVCFVRPNIRCVEGASPGFEPWSLCIRVLRLKSWYHLGYNCVFVRSSIRKAKPIIINTFHELEPYAALNSFNIAKASYDVPRIPQIYSVGPILNHVQQAYYDGESDIIKWLDDQLQNSVVHVCFGCQGSLKEDQVKELAIGLERSVYRFLWSLCRPSSKNNTAGFLREYVDYQEALPQGFWDRTANIGRIVGWIAQFAGLLIATWPPHSEQQLNAFQLVTELGLAMPITVGYKEGTENQPLVIAEEIERVIRRLMESDCEIRMKVKEMRDKSRMSIAEGGSSYKSLESLTNHRLLHAC